MGQRILKPEEEQALCNDIREGVPRREILEKYGISQTLFYEIRKRYGISSRYKDSHGSDKEMEKARQEIKELEEEEDRWIKEFHSRWREAVRPIREQRYRLERQKGVYW